MHTCGMTSLGWVAPHLVTHTPVGDEVDCSHKQLQERQGLQELDAVHTQLVEPDSHEARHSQHGAVVVCAGDALAAGRENKVTRLPREGCRGKSYVNFPLRSSQDNWHAANGLCVCSGW